MPKLASIICLLLLFCTPILPAQTAIAQTDETALRDLNSHCPFTPPASLEAWQARAKDLKLQLQVALGVFPAPQLDSVAPQIYGRVERDDYTIDKVTFESLPGLVVTGNLYRPQQIPADAKLPAILAPHGHWVNARFFDASPDAVKQLLADGSERFENAARNHYQARCVQLARMGCIVFQWDMLGNCDSQQINMQRAHGFANQPAASEVDDSGWLLYSPRAEAYSQSIAGLQTLATQRAIDMLLTLSDVDPHRIGISGASGGGTQTFVGAAVDERIALAFPAVMVSTGMQGGCTCENASLLRIGTGNVEMAALIAPRPLGMTAANDWTRTMPSDGFPQLQQLYGLFGAKDKVALFPALHFEHNFNHVSRVALYGWVNEHFGLGFDKPVLERDFDIALRDELTVWDAEHPQPVGGEAFERKLLKLWAEIIDAQMSGQLQGDAEQLQQVAQTLHDGWRVCLGMTTPSTATVATQMDSTNTRFRNAKLPEWELTLAFAQPTTELAERATPSTTDQAPATDSTATNLPDRTAEESSSHAAIMGPNFEPPELSIAVERGDTTDVYHVRLAGYTPAGSVDGDKQVVAQEIVENPRLSAAYTYGYNLPLFAQRAQQLGLTLQHLATAFPDAKISLHAVGSQTPLAAAGMFVAKDLIPPDSTPSAKMSLQLEASDFAFADVDSIRSPNFLPGAARFQDLPGLVASSGASVQMTGASDQLARFHKLRSLAEQLGGKIE
ncbi:MAG: acetylxylan esterase [Pirellulaceae bacterium]|jgi:hypothetical protein|nr:acetylxylan esterase [Pirellulaceae bacterium]